MPTLAERCRSIQLLVLDVDGVLTAGDVIYADQGDELKAFHIRDGLAMKKWQQTGKLTAIITGRSSKSVSRRATELGIDYVLQGAVSKLESLSELFEKTRIEPQRVCAMGDDLPDLPLLGHVGLAIAPADACSEVRQVAHWVTTLPGGKGAVREALELILRCQGSW